MNCELADVQAGFRKGKGTRDQTDTSAGSLQKQERSRKSSTSTLLTMPKPLSVWITTNWKILQARLHQYVNRELPDVQAGFRKGKGTRDQIATSFAS